MNIAVELIAQLERFAQVSTLPRIRALHLPPADRAESKDAEFCALELDDGAIGLSYVLLDDTLKQLLKNDHRSITDMTALDVARWHRDADGSRRTLGFAAVNALSRCFFDRVGFCPETSSDSLGQMAPVAGDHIGMIGFFPPLVRKLVAAGIRLTVLELKAELAGEFEGYSVSLNAEDLSSCNKVLSTSTVLLNDTLEHILAPCARAEIFAMVGPSAGCLPDALFARGVTLVGGTWINEGRAFAEALNAGQPWSGFARKFALKREDYPGFEALLGRLP
jgi:uncharacterized protein (DUF4213/DUF364 family)